MRWGGGGGGGVEIKMPLCGCTGALAAIAVWSPFVKTAAPMTKTSASTCAPFVALTGKLVLLLCLFFIGYCSFVVSSAENLSSQVSLYHKKSPISRFFVIFLIIVISALPFSRHSRAEGAGIQHNRVAIIQQSQNQSAVVFPLSPPLTRGQIRGNVGFPPLRGENDGAGRRRLTTGGKAAAFRTGILYPRHSRDCGNPPFCHFSICAKAQTAIYRRKWQTPCGGESRR